MKLNLEKYSKVVLIAIALVLVCCTVSLIVLAINGFSIDSFDRGKNTNTDRTALTSRLTETPDYGETYINNVIFIGDSTISAMRQAAVLRDGTDTKQIWSGESNTLSLDYGLSSATIVYPETGESILISEAISLKLPEYVIITLGADNGVAYCTEEKFKNYYSGLIVSIKESSPNTKIILQSVFPVSEKKQKDDSGLTNKKIDRANGWIEELAQSLSVKYLDTASILKDSKGNLLSIYDSGDGVTLNAEGYTAVLNYIRTHGYR